MLQFIAAGVFIGFIASVVYICYTESTYDAKRSTRVNEAAKKIACDYKVQFDPSFNRFYIYKCRSFGKELKIGYGSFNSKADAVTKIQEIRANGGDDEKFFDVPTKEK